MSSASAQSAQPSSPVRADSLSEGILILLGLTIVQRLVGFVRGILFCRWLDAEQLGQWDLAFGFLTLAAPLAVLGLPGSFGRYAETYRANGQLRTFLRRTTWAGAVPAILFCATLYAYAPAAAEFVFGSGDETGLVTALVGALVGFIALNFVTCLFTALRSTRIVSALQCINTVLFAVVGLGMMASGQRSASAAVAAFGISCFAAFAVGAIWIVRLWRELPRQEPSLPQTTLWSKLLPFAFWVWVMNWLANSFELADRYLIVHYGGLTSAEALVLVGQYHTARIIPALFVGLADLLSNMLTPHLVREWEAGDRAAVAARLRFVLKLFVLAFLSAAIGLLIASPLFFHAALNDKFGFGQAIFPWTMACALWTGLAYIGSNWLWCAEKSRLVCVSVACGLAANVALNLQLLPTCGLDGVVWAAAVSKLAMLGVLCLLCRQFGFVVDRGLIVAAVLPACLVAGPWAALAALSVAASGLCSPLQLFDAAERRQLVDGGRRLAERFPRFFRKSAVAAS